MNNFDTSAEDSSMEYEDTDPGDFTINPNSFSEEDYHMMGTATPFKVFSNKIYASSTKYIVKESETDVSANQWYCEVFSDLLLKKSSSNISTVVLH